MIVSMQKVRVLGPRARLAPVIRALQDVGVLHLSRPAFDRSLDRARMSERQVRHVATIEAALDEVAQAMAQLDGEPPPSSAGAATAAPGIAREVRFARNARRAAAVVAGERRALEEERARVRQLIHVIEAFADLGRQPAGPEKRVFYFVLSQSARRDLERIRAALSARVGEAFTLETRPIAGGEQGVALVVPAGEAERIEALLPEAGVRELALPPDVADVDVDEGLNRLRDRQSGIERQLATVAERRRELAKSLWPGLLRARAALNDWLLATKTLEQVGTTARLFVIEGWLPASEREPLEELLFAREGECVVVEDLEGEAWFARDPPVAIANPRVFRPFEVITRWLPLPRYGTIDPTPMVAVFFPLFFGLILGDVGHGALLAILGAVGWARSREGSVLRSVSQVAVVCAGFSILFGILFGEFFGDLGHRLFGMRALVFSRETAIVPFLGLAVALGFVHVLLGLVLGAVSGLRRDPRGSLGRGVAAIMLLFTAGMLLSAVNVLPSRFFTPTAVGLLLAFPVLIAVEGVIGPIEFLSRLSGVLSYARIMALGTASVMLAIAANHLIGALGGAVVGVVFAALFHLVNFALGVFAPTIHGLRLHFVEFYGTFYSPGGLVYRPFRHWHAADESQPRAT